VSEVLINIGMTSSCSQHTAQQSQRSMLMP